MPCVSPSVHCLYTQSLWLLWVCVCIYIRQKNTGTYHLVLQTLRKVQELAVTLSSPSARKLICKHRPGSNNKEHLTWKTTSEKTMKEKKRASLRLPNSSEMRTTIIIISPADITFNCHKANNQQPEENPSWLHSYRSLNDAQLRMFVDCVIRTNVKRALISGQLILASSYFDLTWLHGLNEIPINYLF